MSVLLAGCGELGTAVGLRFVEAGRPVIGIRRRAHLLPAAFARRSVDLRFERPEVPDDTEIVVVALTAQERTAEAYRATYVDGLRHVLEAVDASRAMPRIVLVSSTAVYGVDDGSVVDETTPAVPSTPTGAVLREAETLLETGAHDGVVFRLGGVYGPGRERLVEQVRTGRARLPARPQHTNRIHQDDAAAAVVHLATMSRPPRLVLGVDDEAADLADVLTFIAAELGAPAPAVETRTEPGDAPRAGPGDKRIDNTLLRRTGFRFAYPSYRQGYRALLARDDSPERR